MHYNKERGNVDYMLRVELEFTGDVDKLSNEQLQAAVQSAVDAIAGIYAEAQDG